jgi:hypothetical protein
MIKRRTRRETGSCSTASISPMRVAPNATWAPMKCPSWAVADSACMLAYLSLLLGELVAVEP